MDRTTAKSIFFREGEAPAEPIFRGRSRFRASRLGGSLALPAFGEDFAVLLPGGSKDASHTMHLTPYEIGVKCPFYP